MRILLGEDQIKHISEMQKEIDKRNREEFWSEFIQLMSVGLIGGFLGAMALVGAFYTWFVN